MKKIVIRKTQAIKLTSTVSLYGDPITCPGSGPGPVLV